MAERFFSDSKGIIYHGDSLDLMDGIQDNSVDLIITSPPYPLLTKKDYGNVSHRKWIAWITPFCQEFYRILKPSGSCVIDVAGVWNSGIPTKSVYHYKFVVEMVDKLGFHLAEDLYYWNPAKLPMPAEWVSVRRIRVRDSVEWFLWFSKTPWPKSSNKRVLIPYSGSMEKHFFKKARGDEPNSPSGHRTNHANFERHPGAIPFNLLITANSASNDTYIKYCKDNDFLVHPARFPEDLPEFFIRMVTDEGDVVLDPFAGSCIVGAVAGRLNRRWVCMEQNEDYLKGALSRFTTAAKPREYSAHQIPHFATLWSTLEQQPLDDLGGQKIDKS